MRRRMAKANWNQDDLAAAAGVGKSYISHLLSGHRNPSLQTLSMIADALGCTAADLLKEKRARGGVDI